MINKYGSLWCYDRQEISPKYIYISTRRQLLDPLFLVKVFNDLNFVPPFFKLLTFAVLFYILGTFLCLPLFDHINVVPLLHVYQPQIQFTGILLENNWLHLLTL
jgi:hypothetical protein